MVKYQKAEIQVESIYNVDVILSSSEPVQPPTQKPTVYIDDGGVEI